MDRRKFFTTGLHKLAGAAMDIAEQKLASEASAWIRPPFAVNELDFLLACTRCRDCVEACPHELVFTLPARLGATLIGTPALDLINKACHLCPDWPCVNACDTGALKLPPGEEDQAPEPPRLAECRIDTNSCLPYSGPECGACSDSCPVPDALQWEQTRPWIDPQACVGCALCRQACILEPSAISVHVIPPQEVAAEATDPGLD